MDTEEFLRELEMLMDARDDSVAREHLSAGFPIYFSDEATPPGCVTKLYPDGRREWVRFDDAGEHVVRLAA